MEKYNNKVRLSHYLFADTVLAPEQILYVYLT